MDDPIALTSDLTQMARWVLGLNIKTLTFSVRAENTLWYAGVRTVGDLVVKTPRDILMLHNGGRKVLEEVQRVLAEMGLELAKEAPDDLDP